MKQFLIIHCNINLLFSDNITQTDKNDTCRFNFRRNESTIKNDKCRSCRFGCRWCLKYQKCLSYC